MRLKRLHKFTVVFSLLSLLFWIMSGSLLQASAADTGKLTMICKNTDGVILEGMHWEIYRVGSRTDDNNYVLEGAFAELPVSLEDTSASAFAFAAETLENYAVLQKITPLDDAEADANGVLMFSDLEPGLYLVAGDYLQLGNVYYFPSPFLMEIPDEGEGDQSLDLTVHPKYVYMNASAGSWNYTVKKVWANDEDQPENRSAYITVEIYRDAELHETVRLDESNDWTYEWSSDEFYEWRVLEVEVPQDYYVVYRSNKTQYVIVNTFDGSSSSTGGSEVTGTTTNETTNVTTTTTTTTTVTSTTSTDTEKLPQTGQLWWPVPVFGVAGLLSVAIGLRLFKKE